MDKQIGDRHITRMIAEQIKEEKEGFEHYATIKAEHNTSVPDEWEDTWRTFYIGARKRRLYVAERSSEADGVHVHLVSSDTERVFKKIAARLSYHWEHVDVEVGAKFEEFAGEEFEAPDLFPEPTA
jgi:fructosamine-3-kinase